MELGREFTTSKTRGVEMGFHCHGCGYASQAVVRATGRGAGFSWFGVDDRGAKEVARRRAHDDARYEAEEIIALAPCPRCGERKQEAVSRLMRKVGTVAVLLAVVLGLVGSVIWLGSPGAAILACGGVVAIVVWRYGPVYLGRWRHQEGRIVYEQPMTDQTLRARRKARRRQRRHER